MRINDLINNIKNTGTGINNDLSLVDSAYSEKNKATALADENPSAVGFFNAIENSKKVAGNATYSLNEAKGVEKKDIEGAIQSNFNDVENNNIEWIKNLTGDDYEALEKEGFSVEKYSAKRLERAIERVKDSNEIKDKQLAEEEKQQIIKEKIEDIAANSNTISGSEKLIAKLLYEADIPVTEENIQEIKRAFSISKIEITDSAENYLIKNKLSPTIDNLYKASHSGEMRLVKIDDDAWKGIEEKAEEIVKDAGGDFDKGLANARWLVEHNLPVTKENILYKSELDELRNKAEMNEEFVYRASIKAMQAGRSAGNGVLTQKADDGLDKEFAAVIEGIPMIENAAIRQAFSDGATEETITIPELIKAEETTRTENTDGNTSLMISDELTDREVTTRIRLEEIRVSLNIEAARNLNSKGINVISDSLMRVSEGIRELQKEYFKDIYKELALDDNVTEGIEEIELDRLAELAERTRESLDTIASSPLDLYKATFDVRHTITLAEITDTGETLITSSVKEASAVINISPASMQSALAYYEESSTEVRHDLGDSIKKAFAGSVDNLLTENGLEITEANRRAVRILGYNSMEITTENIKSMKYYDAKVTGLIDRMSGPVVMTMIRDGINPLDSTLDELSAKVDSIIRDQGISAEQKYSEFLVNMENRHSITENERNAYIGIYRLLYNIEKNDGSAIGSLINSGRELSFRNLMLEARSAGISLDMAADDDSEIRTSRYVNSVTAQIDEAFSYNKGLVGKALSVTDAENWKNALSGKDYGAITIENLSEKLGDPAGQNASSSNIKAQEIVNTMTANTPTSAMLKSFGIKDSFENRRALGELVNNPTDEDTAVSVNSEELNEAFDSPSRFDELLGIKTRMANVLSGQAFKTAINAQSAAELNSRVERIEMIQKLAGKGHYRLKIDDGDEDTKQVNLTLIRNSENAGTVSIQISKEGYDFQANLNMVILDSKYNGPAITKGNISVMGEDAKEIKQKTENFKKQLKNNGINADNIDISGVTRPGDAYISYLTRIKDQEKEKKPMEDKSRGALLSVAKVLLAAF